MLIDWFTVGAQAVNFAILVWLMKRFLYKPVLDAIDAREKRIATQLADAKATKAEALRERDDFQRKNAAFDLQRTELLARATDEAKVERQRLIDEAAAAAAAAATRRQEALEREASTLNHAIGLRARQEVFAIARGMLVDLATVRLEAQVCEVFIGRLLALAGPARDRLAEAIRATKDGAVLRSAFDLPLAQRASIGQALNQTFSTDIPLRFETAPDLVAGIELAVAGQKLDWNIAQYIESLGKSVDALTGKPVAAATTPA